MIIQSIKGKRNGKNRFGKCKIENLDLVQFQELRSPEISHPALSSWCCIINLCAPPSNLFIIAMFPTFGCVILHQWSNSPPCCQNQFKKWFVDFWIQSVTVCLPREDKAELLCSGVKSGWQLIHMTQGKKRKTRGRIFRVPLAKPQVHNLQNNNNPGDWLLKIWAWSGGGTFPI